MPSEIRDALIIINPNAGRARKAHLGPLERARKILQGHGIATELANTDGPGAATEIARSAVGDRRQMVIVCGGDGTLNEVVNGLAGSQVPLALLPAGTANVMAKELGLPWHIERAAKLVASSTHRRIALGRVTTEATGNAGRYFLSVGGAGPDGALVRAVNSALKRSTGTLAFWAEGIRQLGLYDFPRFRVTADDESVDATLVVVGRTKHYGGPFRITTEADIYGDDFELMLCTTRSRWKYVGYLAMLSAGRLRQVRGVRFLRATTLRCEPMDRPEAWVQVDGEPAGKLPAEFRIVPDALTLAVPESASGKK
jgi:diacylglycerol kinase (ATP)